MTSNCVPPFTKSLELFLILQTALLIVAAGCHLQFAASFGHFGCAAPDDQDTIVPLLVDDLQAFPASPNKHAFDWPKWHQKCICQSQESF